LDGLEELSLKQTQTELCKQSFHDLCPR